MKTISRVSLLLMLLALPGCFEPSSEEARDTDPAVEKGPSFVNRVWRVEDSAGMSPGQLVVFLSDGTLVFASPFGTPAFGTWSLDGESLTMVEEGVPYEVEIRSLSEGGFEIRSHNPGGFVDIRFVSATRAAPEDVTPDLETNRTSVAGTPFRVPPSQSGRLVLEEKDLRFRACDEAGVGTIIEDVDGEEGNRLLREFGSGPDGIAVLVRLGEQLEGCALEGIEAYAAAPEN